MSNSFTTHEFGDITPEYLRGALWVIACVFCGYLMLGSLISIFANKVFRLS